MSGRTGTIYRSGNVAAALADARQELDRHQAGDDGRCVVCDVPAPCDVANVAAAFMIERRALPGKESGSQSSTVETPERVLLTFGWQRWFARRDPGARSAHPSQT